MGRKKRKDKQANSPQEEKKSIPKELILIALGSLVTLAVTAIWNYVSNYNSEDEEVDQRVDNLYTAIIFKHGETKDKLEKLDVSRLKKIQVIREIQSRYHADTFASLEKIVPLLTDNSSKKEWINALNAHTQIERQEHKDFQTAEAAAFWQSTLKLASERNTNPMASTQLYFKVPAIELASSASKIGVKLTELNNKSIEGVFVNQKAVKFIPTSYPVISNDGGKTIFVPAMNSLDDLNYFDVQDKEIQK